MKRLNYIKICSILLIVLIIITTFFTVIRKTPDHVSMAEILAHPNKFHRKYVRTEGVWQYEFEDHNLYFNDDARVDMVTSPSIWLEISNEAHEQYYEELTSMNGRYVVVTGYFNADNTGMGLSEGAIEKITSCEIID